MPPKVNDSHVALRRRRVASYMIRGVSQQEIVEALPQGSKGITNPKTGKPYPQSSISKDMAWVEEQWAKEYAADIGFIKAQHLAETREARKAAWAKGNLPMVFKSLKHEADVMGLYAPKQSEVDVSGAVEHQNASGDRVETLDEIRRIERHILELEQEIESDGRG